MRVGFTGTREGMTDDQQVAVSTLLDHLFPTEFHHGDCIGADEQAHGMAFKSHGEFVKRVVHPPTNETLRAFCDGEDSYQPVGYLQRNREIVDESEVLIAAPDGETEDYESGTWYTVRYARRLRRPIFVATPSGRILDGYTMKLADLFGRV